jgi:hypothetical protein
MSIKVATMPSLETIAPRTGAIVVMDLCGGVPSPGTSAVACREHCVQGVRGCRRGGLAGQGAGACRCRRCRCMHCSDGQEARRRRDGAEAAATGTADALRRILD